MKNKLVNSVLISILLFVSGLGVVAAQDKNYIGIQYSDGYYSEDTLSKNFSPSAYLIRVGRYFGPAFSIEGRLGRGHEKDTKFLPEIGGGLDISFELDSIMGIYGRGQVDLGDLVSVYGILGASEVEAKVGALGFPAVDSTDTKSGFSYGAGLDVHIGKRVLINLEYINYLDKDHYDFDAIGLGVGFSF
jgi:opacity protein-like surface antigen